MRLLTIIIILFLAIGCDNSSSKEKDKKDKNKKDKKEKKDKSGDDQKAAIQKTEAVWELPYLLKEVSGIALIDNENIACVQDEKGSLFIYNLNKSKIKDEIKFHGKGDFEGLAIAGTTAYALSARGIIFMIENYEKGGTAKQLPTDFTAEQDAEGICYDASGNRLLVVGKGPDPAFTTKKGVYAFNLTSKKMDKEPVMVIDLEDKMFKPKKNIGSVFQPSDIGINPVTKEYYITDRGNNQLAIFDTEGKLRKVVPLDKNTFAAPEGITFSSNGDIYISNESGKDKPAMLVKLAPGAFD